jgi:hypothetical protein
VLNPRPFEYAGIVPVISLSIGGGFWHMVPNLVLYNLRPISI